MPRGLPPAKKAKPVGGQAAARRMSATQGQQPKLSFAPAKRRPGSSTSSSSSASSGGAAVTGPSGARKRDRADSASSAESQPAAAPPSAEAAQPPVQRAAYSLSSCLTSVYIANGRAGTATGSTLYIIRRPAVDGAAGKFALLRSTTTGATQEYVLTGNIQRVFAKFRGDGKATIRLKVPAVDIAITKVFHAPGLRLWDVLC